MNYQFFNKKNNYINHSFLLLIFIFQFALPILIFGHVGLMPQDSLEIGVPHDYIISKIYNGKFEYLDYFLGGTYKWYFIQHIFYPFNILHLLFDIKSFFFIKYFLTTIITYVTFYLLCKKLNFSKFQSSLGAVFYLTLVGANNPVHFDLAFMPYLLYLTLKNKGLTTKNYLIIFFFGLNGGLAHNVLATFFIPILASCFFKEINKKLSIKILLTYYVGLFISDIHLFNVFLSEEAFHRDEMIASSPGFMISLKQSFLIPFLEFNISGYYHFMRLFLIVCILWGILYVLITKNKTGLLLISFVTFIVLIRSIFGTEFLDIFFIGPLSALKGLSFLRVDKIIPITMSLIVMISLKNDKFKKINNLYIILIFVAVYFQQLAPTIKKLHTSVRANLTPEKFIELKNLKKEKKIIKIIKLIALKSNYKNHEFNLGKEIYSWDSYFHKNEYEEIKKIVKNKRIMSVGLDPLVAVVNDMKVIDGYHTLYHASYKKEFRKIIAKEVDKNNFLIGYYDVWANRVYAFYNDKNNLLLNFKESKNLGASFVVSGFEIKSENLKLVKKIAGGNFYIHSSNWQCYLCEKTEAYYLYEIN